MSHRVPPKIPELLRCLAEHQVRYVLAGSVAVQAWGVDVGVPGDLDIVPETSSENLAQLAHVLKEIDARSRPITGRWQTTEDGGFRWAAFAPDHPLYGMRITEPDPNEISTFDSLFLTRYGELDIVPLIAGTYGELIQRAATMTVHGVPDVRVASVADLLAHLTVPRRAKDAGRVQALRQRQTAAHAPKPGSGGTG